MTAQFFRCKICGGDVELSANGLTGTCHHCGSSYAAPTAAMMTQREKRIQKIEHHLEYERNGVYQAADKDTSYEWMYEAEEGIDGSPQLGYALVQKVSTDMLRDDPADYLAYYFRAIAFLEGVLYCYRVGDYQYYTHYVRNGLIIRDIEDAMQFAPVGKKEYMCQELFGLLDQCDRQHSLHPT